MNKTIAVFILVLSVLCISCNDKCVEDNQPLPASFFVEILDEASGENVFENETYAGTDVTVTDVLDNAIEFNFIEGTNIIHLLPQTTIVARNIEIKIKLNNLTTMVSNEVLVKYDVTSIQEECYTSYSFANILFPNNTSEIDEKGVFKVKI